MISPDSTDRAGALWMASMGLLLVVSLAGCRLSRLADLEKLGPVDLDPAELGEMTNVSAVGDLWLGGGPSAADLELAARRGVKSVIDLCQPGELGFDAETVAGANQMAYIGLPIDPGSLRAEDVSAIVGVLEARASAPTLMFSKSGSEAALLFAIYSAATGERTLEESLAEGRRAGMKPGLGELVREHALALGSD